MNIEGCDDNEGFSITGLGRNTEGCDDNEGSNIMGPAATTRAATTTTVAATMKAMDNVHDSPADRACPHGTLLDVCLCMASPVGMLWQKYRVEANGAILACYLVERSVEFLRADFCSAGICHDHKRAFGGFPHWRFVVPISLAPLFEVPAFHSQRAFGHGLRPRAL